MSEENVEIIRRAFAAFEQGGLEAALAFQAPDLVIHSIPEWPDDSEYHGHDGFRKLVEAWTEYFDDFGFSVHEILDADDSVVALLDMRGQLKGAGVPISQHIGGVFSDFRDGKIGQVHYFSGWTEALKAAGLSE